MKHRKKRRYLESLVFTGGQVTRAADLADVSQSLPYKWAASDPEFAEGLAVAKRMAAEALEAEAVRRGFEGVVEPVGWHQGKAGGLVTRYSDNLLMFLLKGQFPDKYKDRMEFRGSLANLNVELLPDEIVGKIADGEHPMAVLAAWAAEKRERGEELPVGLLGAGDEEDKEG
jgi:hypothetical protein